MDGNEALGIRIYDLNADTPLYRCISLSKFMWMVESCQSCLTKVQEWEDPYEAPAQPIADIFNEENVKIFLPDENNLLFGQCWSLLRESDAMWRIYSPNKEGLIIATTVERLANAPGIRKGILAPVIYFRDHSKVFNGFYKSLKYEVPYNLALIKRAAFKHEKEVRLVVRNCEADLVNPNTRENCKHIYLPCDPQSLITCILIDPRATDWYVETVQSYCKRVGFNIWVGKSPLYAPYRSKPYTASEFDGGFSRLVSEDNSTD